jgi:hypothetical protein
MYKCLCPDIPEGLYSYSEIKGSKDIILFPANKEDIDYTNQYPDYGKVIPKKWNKKVKCVVADFPTNKSKYHTGNFSQVSAMVNRSLHESETINLDYLKDALVDGEEFDIKIGEPLSPILFVNHKYLAVVMPMRM